MNLNEIAIIIVLYKPDEKCIVYWQQLSAKSSSYIFIDNTPEGVHINCKNLIQFKENKGIATAQNIGIEYAQKSGFKYVCFFDQDSRITDKLIEGLYLEYDKLKDDGVKIAAIGPSTINMSTNLPYKGSNIGNGRPLEVNTLISSGTFTEMSVLEDVGYMKDPFFIDMVDSEWCWRAKSKGYHLFMSQKNSMSHQVGRLEKNFFGYPIIISSPFRYFYQYRNTFWILRLPYIPIKWRCKILIRKLFELFYVPLKSKSFYPTISAMIKGIKAGATSRL